MLKLQVKTSANKDPIWIVDPVVSIGKNAKNDVVVDSEDVKDFHAQVISKDNGVFIKDVTGDNGCFVNDKEVTEQEVKPGDIIRLNSVEIEVLDGQQMAHEASSEPAEGDGWSLVSNNSWLEGQSFSLGDNTIIGRGVKCDITIPGTHLSRQHCELSIINNRLNIKDLGSSNGTFVNERKITDTEIQPGDILKIDVYSFEVVGPQDAVDENKTQLRPMQVSSSAPRRRTPKNTESEENADKEWKTKSNSPGNREPNEPDKKSSNIVYAVMGLAVIGAMVFILFS